MKHLGKQGLIFLVLIAILIAFGLGRVHSIESISWMQETTRSALRRGRDYTQLPDYFSPESWRVDFDDKSSLADLCKQKIHIGFKKLPFTDSVFCMLLLPILAFTISFLRFGRSLLWVWNIIMYIHKSDGEEVPIGC